MKKLIIASLGFGIALSAIIPAFGMDDACKEQVKEYVYAGNDPYRVLGVARDAISSEIRKAYYALARQLHTDKTGGDEKKAEGFKAVKDAYEILSDEQSRALYNQEYADICELALEYGKSGESLYSTLHLTENSDAEQIDRSYNSLHNDEEDQIERYAAYVILRNSVFREIYDHYRLQAMKSWYGRFRSAIDGAYAQCAHFIGGLFTRNSSKKPALKVSDQAYYADQAARRKQERNEARQKASRLQELQHRRLVRLAALEAAGDPK